MKTRTVIHQEVFNASQEAVFDLLITPSAIRQWWNVSRAVVLAEEGGTWAAAWGDNEDEPDYMTVSRIENYDPPSRLDQTDYRYYSKDGPLPFEASFTTSFTCTPVDGGTLLRVEQQGFPLDHDEFYQGCVKGWKDTFDGIRRYLDHSQRSL
jgi:uncharacterized protein YndB with AHSA1/START domain